MNSEKFKKVWLKYKSIVGIVIILIVIYQIKIFTIDKSQYSIGLSIFATVGFLIVALFLQKPKDFGKIFDYGCLKT